MIRYFKTIQPAALFTIPIIALLLWLPGFFIDVHHYSGYDSLLLNPVQKFPQAVQLVLSILLVTLGAIYLNHITVKHEVIYRHSYLPALFYVLLMSFHRDVIQFHPLLISNLLIIRSLDKTFSLFKNDSPVSPVFDSSFLLAIVAIMYFPAFILFFLLLYSVYSLRSFSFRELTIAVVGFALPFFFLAVYGFCTDTLNSSTQHFITQFRFYKLEYKNIEKPLIIYGSYFLILVIFSLIRLRANFYLNTIKTRSTQEILFLFLLFTTGGFFLLPQIALYHLTQLAIPLSVFLAYYFISAKRRLWIYEAAFWILIGFVVYSYF